MSNHRPTDWRMLCEELVDAIQVECRARTIGHDLMTSCIKADAAPPAEGEAAGPTRDELWELWLRLNNELPDRPAAVAEFWEHAQIDARSRFGHHPAPPAAGEVGEVGAWLRETAASLQEGGIQTPRLTRAADLLEQRHPAPVPVSERLPRPRDCDGEGRCWWGAPALSGSATGSIPHSWRLCRPEDRFGSELVWLPATALPLPQGEVQP